MRREAQGIPVPRVASARPSPHGASHPHELAQCGRLLRRFPYGMGPRFASMRKRMASAGSRQGPVLVPGGAPMQPECMRDERMPAGAAPRSINWRHRLTPLVERGGVDMDYIPINVKWRKRPTSPARRPILQSGVPAFAFAGTTGLCQAGSMTKLLRDTLKQVEQVPEAEQDAAAGALLDYPAHRSDLRLTDEQLAEIRRRRADPERKLVWPSQVRRTVGRIGPKGVIRQATSQGGLHFR
jgi:hypothetical protein